MVLPLGDRQCLHILFITKLKSAVGVFASDKLAHHICIEHTEILYGNDLHYFKLTIFVKKKKKITKHF